MPNGHMDKYRKWLTSHDPHLRLTAIAVLRHSRTHDPDAVSGVVGILETDDTPEIRREAVGLIAELGDVSLIGVLETALGDSDYIVRGRAYLGLKSIVPGCESVPDVAKFIREETHPFCRWCIGEA